LDFARPKMNSCRYNTSVFAVAAVACLLASGCWQPASPLATTPVATVARSTVADAQVTGVSSCSSSGCHGKPFNGIQRDWQTAYHVWAAEDPHRHAFEVLYTERSVEIVQNLCRTVEEKPDHTAALRKYCVGCHATAFGGSGELQMGVSCESCHGKAGSWLDKHYLASWPAERGSASDFSDTSDLSIRAAVCTGCHVGPVPGPDGGLHDVNHDLIAAGHPRLTFELDAYLTNLPKHWDETKDQAPYQGAFHVNAWAAGQEQLARRLTWQVGERQARGPWPEFANFECFDCHHAIRPPGDARAQAAAARGGMPRPAVLPLAQLLPAPLQAQLSTSRDLLNDSWLTASVPGPITAFALPKPTTTGPNNRNSLKSHAQALHKLLATWKGGADRGLTWDQAVQFYLAIEALARDLDNEPGKSLAIAAKALSAELLSQGFKLGEPTQYDSPLQFDPDALIHSEALRQVETSLEAIALQPSN
jgi:hypothetical protein